ncbi:MAG: proton-conducting transporter membrane subunit [Candidatus Omnitrophica bacterium]|nr:proton-conducting transporter membrane subunit [Candidatus Omnitrophota bacterium]
MLHLLVLFPFCAIILLNLPLQAILKRLAFWVVFALSLLQIFLVFFPQSNFWGTHFAFLNTFFKFNLSADGLSMVMLLSIGIVVLTTLLVARQMIPDLDRQANFFSLLLIAMAGMNGAVLARDIFSLYVFLEITAVASFILIAFEKNILAFEGAFKYLILSAVATTMMIAGIALVILFSGNTEFYLINYALRISAHAHLVVLALGLFICGFFIKAGLVPFHGWLPDAYSSAPAPVSIFLAGIVTKTTGVYTLIRIFISIFGFSGQSVRILLLAGAVSVVIGAIAAIGQKDFKRMLAYSSISQVGYIILGLGCGSALGLAGAVLHIFNHAIFKSLLFVNSAAVEAQTGKTNMEEVSGLGEKMPVTCVTSVLGSLSCAGIPPLAGFWSKLLIILALWISGNYIFAGIAILTSVLTLAYLLSIQRRLFFIKGNAQDNSQIKEAGFGISLASLLLAFISVATGIFFPFIINTFIFPFGKIVGRF